jgi:hypothetical protein
MTVKELIEKLQALPAYVLVYVEDSEWGALQLRSVKIDDQGDVLLGE